MHDEGLIQKEFFMRCPTCKQTFQGDVFYDMTKAQLSFVKREFKDVENWHVEAMVMRMTVLNAKKEADRIEGEEICDEILSVIEGMGSSVEFLIFAYKCIGVFHFRIGNDKSLEKAKKYYEKARDACNTSPENETLIFMAKSLEGDLAKVEAVINGNSVPENAAFDLSSSRDTYKHLCQNLGEHEIVTIQHGLRLAKALFETSQTIEALRLLNKLLLTSRRVHGPGHQQTKNAEYLWQQMKLQYVEIEGQPYQALRYEKDRDGYVVNGPVPTNLVGELRSLDDGTTFYVQSEDIGFTPSLPVELHGLKKNAHLNGEIGDIRGRCLLSGRWVVHLEGKASKPVQVKQENLRIVFDLPDPKKESP